MATQFPHVESLIRGAQTIVAFTRTDVRGEIRVRLYRLDGNARRHYITDGYYTDDRADAIGTALAMLAKMRRDGVRA